MTANEFVNLANPEEKKDMFKNPINIGSFIPSIFIGAFMLLIAWFAYYSTAFFLFN
jgi:hypothetical protein